MAVTMFVPAQRGGQHWRYYSAWVSRLVLGETRDEHIKIIDRSKALRGRVQSHQVPSARHRLRLRIWHHWAPAAVFVWLSLPLGIVGLLWLVALVLNGLR